MRKTAGLLFGFTVILALMSLGACTDQDRVKNWGGSMTVKLHCGQKLFDVTWKEDNIWYATRPMHEDEVPETYTYVEESSWDNFEGTLTFVECK